MQYQIKWIKFLGKPRPVVLQVVNGPCPIIALCSVLFLRGELVLKPDVHEVSFEQLCALLRGHLQHSVQTMALRPGASEEAVANALQNLEEVTALLPRLEQGLDINVRFNSPSSFEFTPELSLFDLAGVRLLHGWCYDSEDRETARVLSNMSYNELVNFITSEDAPPTPAKPRSSRDAAAAAAVIAAATAPAAESAPAAQPVAEEPPTADKPSVAAEVPPAATEADAVPTASAESLAAPAATPETGSNAAPAAAPAVSSSAFEVAELKEDLEALHIESQSAGSASASTTAAAPAVASASSSEPESASASSAAFFPSTASASAAASATAASSSSSLSSSPPLSSAALEAKSLRLAQTYQDKNVARAFLNDTQSQLTIAGLSVLHSLMRTDELAVLFRNNHYAVLLKHNERLYTLVSDFGLLAAAPYIVWSFVSDTQGDHLFLDHDWKIPHPTTVDYWQRQDQRQPTAAMAGNHSPMPPQQQQQQQIYQPPPQQQQTQQQYRQQRPQSAQPYGRQQYQQQPQQPAPRPVPPQRKRDSCVVQRPQQPALHHSAALPQPAAMPSNSTPFNSEHAAWQQGVRRHTQIQDEHSAQQQKHHQQQMWQPMRPQQSPTQSAAYRYQTLHQPHRPQQPQQPQQQQPLEHPRMYVPRLQLAEAVPAAPAAPAKWLTQGLESARLQQLPNAEGFFRVTRPIDQPLPHYSATSVAPMRASAPLPHTARPACAFSPSPHAPFSRSHPLPVASPPHTARTGVLSGTSFTASVSSGDHMHPRALFPAHTFQRSRELQPLLPASVRPPPAIVAQLPGRANPRPFAAPPLADVLGLDSAMSARAFPARTQCSATRFKENLLRHEIHINF